MANRIKIRRGSGTPTTSNTEAYELAYDYSADILYIHDGASNTMVPIGGGGDADTLDGLDSTQFLRSDADDETSGELTAAEFIGPLRGPVKFTAKADVAITKGDAVYVFGISGNTPTVDIADANDSNKMPAFGIAQETVSANASIEIITFGDLSNINTFSYEEGDVLYVSTSGTTGNTLTATPPSGESSLIQNIGKVLRRDSSVGRIKVGGAGRSNATPNLNQDKIFLGNASNQAVSTALSSIGLSKFNNDSGYLTSFDITTQTDPKYLRSDAADTATGLLTLNGGVHILSGTGGGKLRIKRNSSSTDGDDIVDLHLDDFGLYVDLDNDNDSDQSEFKFRYKTGGSFTNLLAFNSSSISYKGNTIPTISNMANDRIVTGSSSTTIRGESNVTIDSSSNLQIGGGGQLTLTGGTTAVINVNSAENSFIEKDSGTNLYIANNAQDQDIYFRINDGGTQKIAIKIDASEIGNVLLPNWNQALKIGASGNILLYHSSTAANFINTTGDMSIENQADDKDIILKSDNGSGGTTPYIRLDGSATQTLFYQDTRLQVDGKSLSVGANNDLRMIHDTHSYLQNITTSMLVIQNTGVDQDIAFMANDNGSNNHVMRIQGATGNVGIGVTSPLEELDINGSLKVRGDSAAATEVLELGQFVSPNGTTPQYTFNTYDSAGGLPSAGDHLEIRSVRWGQNISFSRNGQGGAVPTALFYNGGNQGYMELYKSTNPTSDATYTTQVRLNVNGDSYLNGGNVGIGNASPSYKLDITHTGSGLRLNSTGDQQLRFARSGGNDISIEHDTNQLYFYNRSTSKVLMLMANSGDVRVGHNSNPSLEIRNTSGTYGSGSSLVFGHDQGGTNSIGRISSFLIDGSQANRGGVIRHWYRYAGTEHLGLQLGDSSGYLRLYRKGDTGDYLELIRQSDHAEYRVQSGGNYHQFITDSGYANIGPQNSSWNHFYTDRPGNYFSKKVTVDTGIIESYDEDLSLRRAQSSADRIDVADTYIRTITDNAETFRFASLNRSFNNLAVGPINNNSKAYIRANNGYSTATTPDYTWWYNDQCGIYHPAGNTIGFSASGEKVKISTYGLYSADDIYIGHGGSDYSPGLQFMGGSNTPGATEYENAKLAYYDNSGTGLMRYLINRSAGSHKFYVGGTEKVSIDNNRMYVNSSGANGLVMNNDTGTTSNSGRIFFEGTSTSAIYQSGNALSFRTGAASGSSSGTQRFYIDSSGTTFTGDVSVDGNLTLQAGHSFRAHNESKYDKYRMYGTSSAYAIGMYSGNTYGGLNDWAMTFTFNDEADRGFLWRDTSHGTNGGAMGLTTNGKLTVAHSARIGYGETDTTIPGATYRLDVSGSIGATADVVAYISSDKRLKDNIKNIENPLEKLQKLNGVEFDWNDKQDLYKGHDIGVIAQEVEEVLPEIVDTREDGHKAVKYDRMVALLIEAVKEQQVQINELKTKLGE